MTTSSECDKITFVLNEDKTYFTIISRRFSHGKRHDKGKSASGHSAVYAAADYRKHFPAALQHGRHDYRWPICRSGCTGCSWFYGNDYVPGAWICAGHHSRLYGSDIAAVRCKGYARSKAKCGKRHSTGSPFHGCPDVLQHDLHAAAAASHEHTGEYFSGCLYLYYDYLRWPDRYDFLQSAFLLSACSRKQPDSADVPDFFGCIKCSSGSASHHSF